MILKISTCFDSISLHPHGTAGAHLVVHGELIGFDGSCIIANNLKILVYYKYYINEEQLQCLFSTIISGFVIFIGASWPVLHGVPYLP